jgi:hypothetical protein
MYTMSGLSGLNTATLFMNSNNNNKAAYSKINNTGKITVDSLFKKEEKSYEFNSKVLLDNINKRKIKLEECYNDNFKKCCDIIMSADKRGISCIRHEISPFSNSNSNYVGYKNNECIEFIKKKLEEQKLTVTIINETQIYITGTDI